MHSDAQEQLIGMERIQVIAQFADQARTNGLEYGYDPKKLETFMTVRAFVAETAITAYGATKVEEITEKMVEEIALGASPLLQKRLNDSENERRTFKRLAEIDALTGVGSRLAFEAAKATAETAEGVAFLELDADNFKEVNDKFGHDAGDETLKGVARHVRQVAERYGFGERVFRVGGDEFMVLPSKDVAEELLEEIVNTYGDEGNGVQRYGSVSVSLSGGVGNTVIEADHRLYQAKEAKKQNEQV